MSMKLNIKNISDRELDLSMRLDNNKQNGYVWNCKLNYQIGKIGPKNSVEIILNLIPFNSGFLRITGISITDLFLKRIHEFTQVANVFVKNDESDEFLNLK